MWMTGCRQSTNSVARSVSRSRDLQRVTIEAVGAHIRYLPPYSPDFNPIEQTFAKLKAFLRPARPRTFDQVLALVTTALELFTPDECRNYIQHCGYVLAVQL